MNHTFYSTNYNFQRYRATDYRYTDARSASNMHFIARMRKGHCRIVGPGITLEVPEGGVFYIPAGFAYQSYWYGEPEIEFDSLGFWTFPEAGKANYLLQLLPSDPQINSLIDAAMCDSTVTSKTLGAFYMLLGLVLPQMYAPAQTQKRSGIMQTAEAYLVRHPRARIAEVARCCGVSESGLYNVFRDEGGSTPNALRHQILCQKAVHYLQTTDMSVEQISRKLEFSSASYFRKILFAVTGKTPRQLRKEAKGI